MSVSIRLATPRSISSQAFLHRHQFRSWRGNHVAGRPSSARPLHFQM